MRGFPGISAHTCPQMRFAMFTEFTKLTSSPETRTPDKGRVSCRGNPTMGHDCTTPAIHQNLGKREWCRALQAGLSS
jgi:hypothetical protein